jgi:hypothetical protein
MEVVTGTKKETKNIVLLLFFISLAQLAPFFILREQVAIPVNDTMDAYIPQYKVTAVKAFAFCKFNTPVDQIMNGLNRDLLVSGLNVIYLLFLIFNAFWAFTINLVLIKIVAFTGMYLFLKNNFTSFSQKQAALGAFLFSCIPFFPFFGIGIAGQPLLLNTLINIHKKRSTYTDILVLIIFPFYSSLIFTNIFILFFLFLGCVFLIIQRKKIPFHLIMAGTILLLLGLLVEYRLLHATSDPSFIPHRFEFNIAAFLSSAGIAGLVKAAFRILVTGIFHVETFYSVFAMLLFILYIKKAPPSASKKTILAILITIAFIGLLFGFTHAVFYGTLVRKISFLKAFQIDRFYTLLPMLYFLLGIFSIQQIYRTADTRKKNYANGIVVLAFLVVFFNNFQLKALVHPTSAISIIPTYAAYYDTDLLNKVKETIPVPLSEYRVAGVGIDPEVLQFNGFYTLDAYLNIYPLSYKKKFRRIIAPELDKSVELKTYFDDWGNRCYIFSTEIGRALDQQSRVNQSIRDLAIDTQALKAMSDKTVYLLSTKKIENAEIIGLTFIKEFHSTYTYRNALLLYKVQ